MALGKPSVGAGVWRSGIADQPVRLAAATLAALLVACLGFSRLAPMLSTSANNALPQVARTLAAGLFLVAGVLRIVWWRLTGSQVAARAASASIVLGCALAALPLLGPMLQHSPALALSHPAARLLFVVPVLAVLAVGPRSAGAAHLRPRALTAALLGSWVAASALTGALRVTSARSVLEEPGVWQVAEYAAALAWVTLAVRAWRRVGEGSRARQAWIAVALLLMGASEAARGWAIAHQPAFFIAPLALQFAVATIAVTVAAGELRDTFRTDELRTGALALDLAETRTRLDRVEQLQQERAHDARSAVAGVVGAVQLLAEPDRVDADRLRLLMTAELHRLQESLDPDASEPITEFPLAEVLEPVVLSHRLAGGSARVDLGTARVVGRPLATATVLANLLANVRSHAPGATVDIRTELHPGATLLIVEDDGPGIAEPERREIFRRGVRGSAIGPGSGLGLYTAARTMTDQFGSLRLVERPGGGTRLVLTMRSAAVYLRSVRAS